MTMRALRLEALGEDFAGCRIADIPVPEPTAGEVRVRVRAAAINFVDLLMTRGDYQTKPPLPFTIGADVAGEVDALGEGVTTFVLGQPVMGMRMGGAFAEFAVLSAKVLRPKPAGFSFGQAAAYGAAYFTAYHALTRRTTLRPGDWLLVHGSTGGVGLAAVDLARTLGVRVIAASSSREKLAVVQETYAPDVVLDTSTPFRDEVLRITDGRGADAIFDPVGGTVFRESTRCIAFGGDYLVVGFASGIIPEIAVNIPLIKGFSIVGVRAGEYGRRFPERDAVDRQALWTLADEGKIAPRVDGLYPLEEWAVAFAALRDRQVVGRVVLDPGNVSS